MRKSKLSRRDILQGASAFALGTAFASPARAVAPPPEAITPQLIEAAKKEAKVVLYSAMDLPVGEKLGKAFEAQYPGMQVQIERAGMHSYVTPGGTPGNEHMPKKASFVY